MRLIYDCFVAGYCGPTCLTSTCTNCDSDIVSDEITLDLTTGEALGNLTGATVESMSVTTNEDGANVDCKFKARVKVKCTHITETSSCDPRFPPNI